MGRPMRRHAFRLASIAGRLDVDQLMSEIPSTLFNEWVAYHLIEPPDAVRISAYLLQLTSYVCSFAAGEEVDPEVLFIEFGKSYMEDGNDHAEDVAVKLKASLASFQERFPHAIKKVE